MYKIAVFNNVKTDLLGANYQCAPAKTITDPQAIAWSNQNKEV